MGQLFKTSCFYLSMVKVDLNTVEKLVKPVVSKIEKAGQEVMEAAEQHPSDVIQADASIMRAYSGIKTPARKLFTSLDEFSESFRRNLQAYKEDMPEGLFRAIEKSAEENNFAFSKVRKEYYSGLAQCKTMEEVRKLYPEFKSIKLDPQGALREDLERMIPADLSEKFEGLASEDEKIEYVMKYFDKVISEQAKRWPAYPEFIKCQRQIAQDYVSGKFKGCPYSHRCYASKFFNTYGSKYGNNPKMPAIYEFLGNEDADGLFIDLLKQIHIEGKNLQDAFVTTSKGRKITANLLQRHNLVFLDRKSSSVRNFLTNAEQEATEFLKLGNLSKEEISSAVMARTWTKSELRRDFGNACKYGSGWSNIRYILQKEKYPDSHAYPTEQIIDAYLVELFKLHKVPNAKNPFEAFELADVNVDKLKKFVNMRYVFAKHKDENRELLSSNAFKTYKKQFDVDAMKKSWENIEQHYKKAFFKSFWRPERVERFTKALNESYEIASKNIEISDELLSKAMLEAIE